MSGFQDFGPKGWRDRELARQPRYGGSRVESFDHLVKGFLTSEEVARMKRFGRVRGALDKVLSATEAPKVQPVRLVQGQLTLEVADGILLAELRSHRQTALLEALAADRTGVTRLVWRLKKG